MRPNPYDRFGERELTLADRLAVDRTVLANERTALAYARTALGMLVVGGSAVKFFEAWTIVTVGAVFIGAAVGVGAIGAWRYLRTRRFLAEAVREREAVAEAESDVG